MVGLCLTVERTPPINERLDGLGSASAPAWRLPAWRRHTVAKHLAHCPYVIGDACRHRRRLPIPIVQREAAMHRTEVIYRPDQIHPPRHGRGPARGTPRSAAQHRQTTAERPI